MKRKDVEQLKNATEKELMNQAAEAKLKLRGLMFDRELNKIKNPHEIQNLKKEIARMLTFARQKNATK